MQRLLQFLYKYRIFILFVIIESICFWIIVANNNYQGSKYLNSANKVSASLVNTSDQVSNYFELRVKNIQLAEENARLRQQLLKFSDSSTVFLAVGDSSTLGIKAKVIDNSLFFRNNYIILNKGANDGVQKGMGVLGPDGVVGQVQQTSANYTTVLSLLHSKTLISAKHQPTGSLCSVSWIGQDEGSANVEYLPRHLKIQVGDSILTSGYNSVYPKNNLIGIVSKVNIGPNATFYEIGIDLATNFSSLSFVYLLHLEDKVEIDSLRNFNLKADE